MIDITIPLEVYEVLTGFFAVSARLAIFVAILRWGVRQIVRVFSGKEELI
jgi:hypothetical protein